MTAVVDGDERVLRRQRLVGGEELQITACCPAVQQQHDRRLGIGVAMESVEQLTTTGHDQRAALRKPRDHGVGQAVAHSHKRYRHARLPGRRTGNTGELLKLDTQLHGSSKERRRIGAGATDEVDTGLDIAG